MADKSFGVKELNLLNASGTPTVTSPNNLNLNANTVAISTSATVGNNLTVSGQINVGSNIKVGNAGVVTATSFVGSGSGLTGVASTDPSNIQATWKLGGGSGSGFTFTGPGQDGSEGNPDIYLVRGQRYLFDNTTLAGNHPFEFRNAANDADYTDGVSGAQNGLQYLNVQHDAPARLKYRCTIHTGSMLGDIYIIGGPEVISGVVTATTFVGNLTGNVTGTASANAVLTGSTNNTLVTVTGANAITGESTLTYNGSDTFELQPASATPAVFVGDSNRTGAGQGLAQFRGNWNGTTVARITFDTGDDTTNKDDGFIRFDTSSTGTLTERVRITRDGKLGIGNVSSPDDKVEIRTGANDQGVLIKSTGSTSNAIKFDANRSGANQGLGSIKARWNGTTVAQMFMNTGDDTSDKNDGYIIFGTESNASNGNANATERFRIASQGQLGIGGANYGTSGQVLKSGGSSAAPSWGDAGGHTETYARVVFGAVYDTNSGYIVHNITSGSSNGITIDTTNERVTPTVAGTYLVIYNAHWGGLHSSGATYYNRITKNGSEYISSNFSAYDPGTHMHTVMTTMPMNGSSDYIQFEFYENKSGAAAYVNHKSRAVVILLDT